MARVLHQRRQTGGIAQQMQKLLGLEQKMRQYEVGEKFVRGVLDIGGPRQSITRGSRPRTSRCSPSSTIPVRGWCACRSCTRPDADAPRGRYPRSVTSLLVVDEPRERVEAWRVALEAAGYRIVQSAIDDGADVRHARVAARRDRARRAVARLPGVGVPRVVADHRTGSGRGSGRRDRGRRARSKTACGARSRARCVASPSRSRPNGWSRHSTRCSRPTRRRSPSSDGAPGSARSRCWPRIESRGAASDDDVHPRLVHLTRLEHGPVRSANRSRSPTRAGALPTLTTKQRGLLHLIEAEGGVTAAAARLGTSRGNVYAGLRRIVHRLGVRDTGELLRLIGSGELLQPGPVMSAYRRAVAPWSARVRSLDDLAPGARVVVGCSGGADSLALLALARARDLDVVAVYVDHGLRGRNRSRRAGRAQTRRPRSAPRRASSTVDVDASANLEARARDARYARARARRRRSRTRSRSSSGTRVTTRPRRCCWRCCGGAARPGSPGCRRSGGGCAGRCSSCAAPIRTRSAPGCGGRRCAIR